MISATPAAFCHYMQIQPAVVVDAGRSLYNTYCEALVTEGLVQWRHHSEDSDTVILNDYSHSTGEFLPNSYAHTTCVKVEGENLMTCSCKIYQQVQNATMANLQISPEEEQELFLDASQLTCMHCRFF